MRNKHTTKAGKAESYAFINPCKLGFTFLFGAFFYHSLLVVLPSSPAASPPRLVVTSPLTTASSTSTTNQEGEVSTNHLFGISTITSNDIQQQPVLEERGHYSLAFRESRGFFTDISERDWTLLKKRFQESRPNEFHRTKQIFRAHNPNHPNYPKFFWQENYDPEFTCPHESKFGGLGDGGKWVCDAHRIDKDNCLVYSIGSFGDFTFESSVLSGISKKCEIHTFDRDDHVNQKQFDVLAKEAGVEFHHVMLGEPTSQYPNGKRFREIIQDLKHEGKTIDILKIDCEGCEWEQYAQWFEDFQQTNVTVRQFLIELHNSPPSNVTGFFHRMWESGYVIFHKEANYPNANCLEMAFVLLSKDFMTQVVDG